MKIKAHGPFSVHWPNTGMWSPIPGEEIDVANPTNDEKSFLVRLADVGFIEFMDDEGKELQETSNESDASPEPPSISTPESPTPKRTAARRETVR